MKSITQIVLGGIAVGSYLFVCGASPSQKGGGQDLLAKAMTSPLTDAEINVLAAGGKRTMVAALNRLPESRVYAEITSKLGRGYNIGAAIDRDVYANNVVRLGEARPDAMIEAVNSRFDPRAVKAFGLGTKEFQKLGAFAVKPLVIVDLVQRDRGRGYEQRADTWIRAITDEKRLDASLSKMSLGMSNQRARILPIFVAALVAKAVWEVGEYLVHEVVSGGALSASNNVFVSKDGQMRPIRLDLLSPATKQKLRLAMLDGGGAE